MPKLDNSFNNMSCGTMSNALEKSKITMLYILHRYFSKDLQELLITEIHKKGLLYNHDSVMYEFRSSQGDSTDVYIYCALIIYTTQMLTTQVYSFQPRESLLSCSWH